MFDVNQDKIYDMKIKLDTYDKMFKESNLSFSLKIQECEDKILKNNLLFATIETRLQKEQQKISDLKIKVESLDETLNRFEDDIQDKQK